MEPSRLFILSLRKTRRSAAGFTLIEVMIATLVVLVGLIAAAQLVPLAINRNLLNRNDSKATVVAEQVLDQILSQKISDPQATIVVDNQNFVILLGGPGTGQAGSPISTGAGGQAALDYSVPAVPGYNFVLFDPNNPASPAIEVRWGVITIAAGTAPVSKRFVVSAWRRDSTQDALYSPIAFDGFMQR